MWQSETFLFNDDTKIGDYVADAEEIQVIVQDEGTLTDTIRIFKKSKQGLLEE